jgi:MYXO-CTERM domain-containing protein
MLISRPPVDRYQVHGFGALPVVGKPVLHPATTTTKVLVGTPVGLVLSHPAPSTGPVIGTPSTPAKTAVAVTPVVGLPPCIKGGIPTKLGYLMPDGSVLSATCQVVRGPTASGAQNFVTSTTPTPAATTMNPPPATPAATALAQTPAPQPPTPASGGGPTGSDGGGGILPDFDPPLEPAVLNQPPPGGPTMGMSTGTGPDGSPPNYLLWGALGLGALWLFSK